MLRDYSPNATPINDSTTIPPAATGAAAGHKQEDFTPTAHDAPIDATSTDAAANEAPFKPEKTAIEKGSPITTAIIPDEIEINEHSDNPIESIDPDYIAAIR
jgi:hypothetical protein